MRIELTNIGNIVEEGAVSIEKGISKKRAAELTGEAIPSAFRIRESFGKMTESERSILLNNVKSELAESMEEKKALLQQRRDAFVPDKPLFTNKIKALNKLAKGKQKRLDQWAAL